MAQPAARSPFEGKPYLQCLESLHGAFPALKSFLEKLANDGAPGREAVRTHYQQTHQRVPGRCVCLNFEDDKVSIIKEGAFESPAALRTYLEKNPATHSRANKQRRLFILEDMEPDYVDALGHHLGVDPLVFSEQMNTWNFTDSWSIPYRGLPSMSVPGQSFTLRYYELRTLFNPKSVRTLSLQMSFAINRRRYERWRDVDVPSAGKPDRRHAFVRRCASFWTSQDPLDKGENGLGWDAVIMVDPAFSNICDPPPKEPTKMPSKTSNATTLNRTPDGVVLDEAAKSNLEESLILKDHARYDTRADLWKAQEWGTPKPVTLSATIHKSWPYHSGCSTLAPLMFSQVGIGAQESNIQIFKSKRDLTSALDEMVFYWTRLATRQLINHTNEYSSNASYYLLKHIAQHWINHLELMNTTIAKAEWFSDDYQARIDDNLSHKKWKTDLINITEIAQDINYMRRHLNHFWRAMVLNLERLGIQLGDESVDEGASLAIRDAQKDFLAIHTRMQPIRDRAEALNSVSNDLANLRAAFRGVHDGEFGLRLSLFASIVFPLTLVASIFSMGDDYLPGSDAFWKLWAIGPPFCICVALALVYGKRPWRFFMDIWEYGVLWRKAEEKRKKRDADAKKGKEEEVLRDGRDKREGAAKRAVWKTQDEEQGFGK